MYQTIISGLKSQINGWKNQYPDLDFVYNKSLDEINPSEVKYILVGDNPGQSELETGYYLIGKAGQVARNLFCQMGIDFDSQVLVLNKTVVFTKQTAGLKGLLKTNPEIINETQIYMAEMICRLQEILGCPVLIVGISDVRKADGTWLKSKSLFRPFFSVIQRNFSSSPVSEQLLFGKHFSYGNFSKDLQKAPPVLELEQKVRLIGEQYRREFLKTEKENSLAT